MAVFSGTNGDDDLVGTTGNDSLYGNLGIDMFRAGPGNDLIVPGTAPDGIYQSKYVLAGSGNDTIDMTGIDNGYVYVRIYHFDLWNGIFVTLDASGGSIVKTGAGTTTLLGTGVAMQSNGMAIYGSAFSDRFDVTPAEGGFLSVAASAGNDTINIGAHAGYMRLNYGDSSATSGANINLTTGVVANDGFGGQDRITGPGHVTQLFATELADTITGSEADDELYGWGGNDSLLGGDGGDYLRGWTGDDYLDAGDNAATLLNDKFVDWIDPHSGNDTVEAGNTVNGFLGVLHRDLVDAGPMTYDIDGIANTASIDKGANGTTTILNAATPMLGGMLQIFGTASGDTFNATAANGGRLVVNGGQGDDTITIGGSSGAVVLSHFVDNRFARPDHGITADLAAGTVSDDGFGGRDTIVGLGNAMVVLRGTALADTLLGSDFVDGFYPSGGNDTIDGRGGVDLLSYEDLDYDTGVTVTLGTGRATGSYAGTGFTQSITSIEHVTGSGHGDVIAGTAAAETLEGLTGDDLLMGEAWGLYHTELSAQVYRLYVAVLGREPDWAGHQGWAMQLASGGASRQDIANGFVAAREFTNVYGTLDNDAFVERMYLNVLDRPSDAAGKQGWLDAMAKGASRADVALGFANSPEFITRTAPEAAAFDVAHDPTGWADDVYRLYAAMLDRAPDLAGLTGWIVPLADGTQGFDQVVAGFMGSAEFQKTYGGADNSAFVRLLYDNVLDRAADQAGLNGWVAQLDGGTTRASVVQGFMASAEFITRTAPEIKAWMLGQGGDDVLKAGPGNDTLSGGLMSDTFVFSDDGVAGTVTVTDLETWDRIDITDFGLSAPQALAAMAQDGGDVLFTAGDEVIRFLDTRLADVTGDMLLV